MRKNKLFMLFLSVYFILIGLSLNSTVPYKGDESYYLVSAINMVKTGNYFVPYYYNQPRFQKPILPYWITAISYKIFGISLWSGRLFFLIIAILQLILIYRFAILVIDEKKFAFLNVILLASSTMFILFSRAAMTDLLLTFFSTISLYFFYRAIIEPSKLKKNYFYAYVSMGFAFLSKGWFGFLPAFTMLIYLFIFKPENFKMYILNLLHPLNIFTLFIISFFWYFYVFIAYKKVFLLQLRTETRGRFVLDLKLILKKIIYYVGVLIRYYFPITIIGIYLYIKRRIKIDTKFNFLILYFAFAISIYIFFISMFRSRYLLPVFPMITLIISFIIYKTNYTVIMKKVAGVFFIIQILVLLLLPIIRKEPLKELVKYWEKGKRGTLSVYNMDLRNLGWLYILTEGNINQYRKDSRYIIIKESDYDKLKKGYSIEKEASQLKTIKFNGKKFTPRFKKFLLLKKRI